MIIASKSSLLDRIRSARRAYRQIFGIPDFERYIEHRTSHHPGEPVLSRREFYRAAIDRKYGRNGARCC
jgi:uncharacterized short protein YbdD (DUF466 family)